jgi:hypothetical protein
LLQTADDGDGRVQDDVYQRTNSAGTIPGGGSATTGASRVRVT